MDKKETKKEAKKEAVVKVPAPAKVEIVNTANGPMVKGPNGSLRPLPADK
tara:strand:+ start:1431 stop:1580 length:150 start_codon:yes stop_codon:yes gene_type:complete